jgi:hypothetical protein
VLETGSGTGQYVAMELDVRRATSESNAQFDAWLRARDSASG